MPQIYTLAQLKNKYENELNKFYVNSEPYGERLRKLEPQAFENAFIAWMDEEGIEEYEHGYAYIHDVNSCRRSM